jgi:hypothetical protein
MAYDFKYIRTGTGELSGPSMIWQTEQALTQIGTYADEANTQADEALETANTALNKANNAAEAAERAQNTADTAQAAASHAQETADAAQVAADNAQDTADEALETAQKGVADAAKAQAAADKAQATADAAQDAADAAQLTADNAQNAADKAQDAADAAQQTANDALNAASNSQGSANVAQDTADNALLVAQSTQQAFYEHVREYTPQIAKALGEFEADNTTVNFDNFTDSVKLYITSPDASITGPNDKVNSPFYLWNFTTDDRSSTAQFVYAANGLTYSRYGTIEQNDLVPGTDTYTLENNSKNAILTCNGVASGMTITKSGSLTNTWTASDTHNSYITGTWNIKGITNGTIDLNGVTIANLSDTGFYPTGQQQLQEDNTSFVIEDMTYSADDGLTIKVTVQWLNIDSQISWDSWKVDTPAVDTPAVDNVTIKYNSSNELQAKDVAIGGNASDLASARGQIGDAKEMPNLDFNTLTTPGNYRITGYPTNGPSLPLNISGASIGSLIVAGIPGQNGRIFQIMISGSAVTWRTIQDSTGTTWSAWQQLLSGNKVGDGIRVTNGIISVPEYEGATVSAAGTSGLVPPAAAGQQESFLTGGGEYKPALTKISDSVSLADSTTAASAKAVKAAYDLANGKQAALGFTPVQQGGGANQYASKIYLGWDGGAVRVQVDGSDMGQLVTTLAGQQKAPNAAWADGAQFALRLRREGNVDTIWNWAGQGGQPGWLWGGNDSVNMYVYNPANFSVNYANSAYMSTAVSGVWFGRNNQTVPSGGTWRVITSINGKIDFMTVAGGTSIPHDWWYAVRVA